MKIWSSLNLYSCLVLFKRIFWFLEETWNSVTIQEASASDKIITRSRAHTRTHTCVCVLHTYWTILSIMFVFTEFHSRFSSCRISLNPSYIPIRPLCAITNRKFWSIVWYGTWKRKSVNVPLWKFHVIHLFRIHVRDRCTYKMTGSLYLRISIYFSVHCMSFRCQFIAVQKESREYILLEMWTNKSVLIYEDMMSHRAMVVYEGR